jgi:hypothetical protein
MGGAFALITSISLFDNAKIMTQPYDKNDIQYFRHAGIVLAISLLAVIAGVAIHKFQWWSLPLVGGIAFLIIGYSITRLGSDLLGAETFTILVPMALILIWACLPATWLEFKRQGAKVS